MHAHLLFVASVVAGVSAQQTITIPAGVVGRDGTSLLAGAGFEQPLREQFLFGTSHLNVLAGRDL